jgi:amino acid permease
MKLGYHGIQLSSFWKFFLCAVLVVAAGALAVLFPYLADVVNLLGAFTLTSMCYIFPFAFALPILKGRIPGRQRTLLWITAFLGTVAMAFCTYNAIYQMMNKDQSPGGTPAKP